jgi:hypothetical protein
VRASKDIVGEVVIADFGFKTKDLESIFSLSFLLAIVALQKFTDEKIRNRIVRTFNVFNIKIKRTQNSLPSGKNLFGCSILNIFFQNIFSRFTINSQQKFLVK